MPNWISRVAARILPTTLAGKFAATTAALVATLVSAAAIFASSQNNSFWGGLDPGSRIIICLVAPALPLLTYIGVRIWGREDDALYPDIDEAWNAGIAALSNVGLSPSAGTVPLFLILGGGKVEEAFAESMQSTGEAPRVDGVPNAAGVTPALRWYATDSGIYLFCSRVGALCSLVEMWKGANELKWEDNPEQVEVGTAARKSASHSRILVSVSADDISRSSNSASAIHLPVSSPVQSHKQFPINVNFVEEADRLAYLCRRIKHSRRPRCGINGSIVILPVEFPEANKDAIAAIARSIRKDIRVLHDTLRLRFPISGLVVGMEQATGFNELARLLGPSHIRKRLGAGFDIYRRASSDRIVRLCDYICSSLETFVYALYGRPNEISGVTENRKIYRLLCQIRGEIKPKACELLIDSFARGDRDDLANAFENGGEPPAYFSGCYFASTGSRSDEQAFVKGVFFDKLVFEQGKVEWTTAARRTHFRFRVAVMIGWTLFTSLFLSAVVRILWSLKSR